MVVAGREASIRVERYRDLQGRTIEPWVRRVVMLLFAVLAALVLAGLVGQREERTATSTPAATLAVKSPTRLRGGLLYQSKITVTARRRLDAPRLVLDAAWLDGLTLNTTEPAPTQELNRNGHLVFEYDAIEAGERLDVWLQYQVNPTTVGSRDQTIELDDGQTPVAALKRSLTVFP